MIYFKVKVYLQVFKNAKVFNSFGDFEELLL